MASGLVDLTKQALAAEGVGSAITAGTLWSLYTGSAISPGALGTTIVTVGATAALACSMSSGVVPLIMDNASSSDKQKRMAKIVAAGGMALLLNRFAGLVSSTEGMVALALINGVACVVGDQVSSAITGVL